MKIVDLHCDTIARLMESKTERLSRNKFSVDMDKLRQGGSFAQVFALFVNMEKVKNPFVYADAMLNLFMREMQDNADEIALAKNSDELQENERQKKISAILSIEEGGVVQGKLENLRFFYERGVRLMTLTWNYPNEIGFPNHKYVYKDRGLTEFGRECVCEMNKLGMIVDVSHLSDKGFYDVAEVSSKPFIASHSNSRAMWEHSRNLTDDMIRVLAEKGGVTGINYAAYFLGEGDLAKVDDMVRHIRHIYNIGGIDVLALGSDFDGISNEVEMCDFSLMSILIHGLQKHGFSDDDIEKITHRNSLRVFNECLG